MIGRYSLQTWHPLASSYFFSHLWTMWLHGVFDWLPLWIEWKYFQISKFVTNVAIGQNLSTMSQEVRKDNFHLRIPEYCSVSTISTLNATLKKVKLHCDRKIYVYILLSALLWQDSTWFSSVRANESGWHLGRGHFALSTGRVKTIENICRLRCWKQKSKRVQSFT